MKLLPLIAGLLLLTGCMSAAQKAQQQAQIQQLVNSLTPEQRAELNRKILERMTGLDQAPAQHVSCWTNSYGNTYCNSY